MSNTNNNNNTDMNMAQSSYIKGRMHYNINNCEGSIVCPDWVTEYNSTIPIRPLECMDNSRSQVNNTNYNQNTYKTPQGLYTTMSQPMSYSQNNYPFYYPLLPMYGYDNSKELDKDMEYMKNLYPSTCKKIQYEIDEECDKLEYDGSCMFDQYPDKCHLDSIIGKIFKKVVDSNPDLKPVNSMDVSEGKKESENPLTAQQFYNNYNNDWLRYLIQIMLYNELFNRRRRYRRRRRWY